MQLGALIACWGDPLGSRDPIDPNTPVGAICTDSRALAVGQLFIALVGERFDGHAFLPQAAAAGAQAAVVQRGRVGEVPAGLLHWVVDDTLYAYQQLAAFHRQSLLAPVVAVTGSAGKTTTRELIRAALAPLGPVVASSGNENNDIGVPLTLFKADAATKALVVEMGMRGLGEIERLSHCTAPDVAVITNIGTAHIGRLGSREAIATAKCEITASLKPDGLLVIPAGDPLLEAAVAQVWSGRVCRVALGVDEGSGQADLLGDWEPEGQHLVVNGAQIQLPLSGRHNARNVLLAYAVAQELEVPLPALQQLQVEVPGGRNRKLQLGGLTLLDETYNASPEAVLAALDLLAAQPGRRFAVLGTMLELGDQSLALHRQVAERAAALALDGLVVVSSDPEATAMANAAAAIPRLAVVGEPQLAAKPLTQWLQAGDVLLLKASRGVGLERLIPLLPSV
ncbi:MAG: UDP-N-acetylmuramoyl-tripeptide--D-alanyl-D-alanine ligase [Cyanobacteria bacterium M_surface_10_m2_179]|nr:UDP-N-acetylmuramoyl-tripeptide--D-alanyl-D-alanine ligase [Cyanobacteria bacterium M_surface_10_m2_179]